MTYLLEKTLRLNYLFDFYQELLTERQREYMKMYYFDDFSLVEISEVADVSRQAVYDNLKRTEASLESYEQKLSLYFKFEKRMKIITQLETKVQMNGKINELFNQLKEIG